MPVYSWHIDWALGSGPARFGTHTAHACLNCHKFLWAHVLFICVCACPSFVPTRPWTMGLSLTLALVPHGLFHLVFIIHNLRTTVPDTAVSDTVEPRYHNLTCPRPYHPHQCKCNHVVAATKSDLITHGSWLMLTRHVSSSQGATLRYRKIQNLELDPIILAYLRKPIFCEACARIYGRCCSAVASLTNLH